MQAPKVSLLTQRFGVFWKAYPKKVSKGDAEKVWNRIRPDDELLAAMLAAIEWQRGSPKWVKERGQFIPNPATWLAAKGWDDEPEEGVPRRPPSESPPQYRTFDPAADFARQFGPVARSET